MVVESQSGLMVWLQQYGSIVAFFAQMAFWVVVGVAAIWATLLYKRYVDFITGTVKTVSADAAPTEDAAVSVDEFVE